MPTNTAELAIRVKVDELAKQLAAAGNLSQKEAAKLANKIVAEAARSEKAVKDAGKATEKAAKAAGSAIAEGVVPKFEKLSQIVEAVGTKVGLSSKAIVGITGGIALAGAAAFAFAGTLADTVTRVDEIAAAMSKADEEALRPQIRQLQYANEAWGNLGQSIDNVKVSYLGWAGALTGTLADKAAVALNLFAQGFSPEVALLGGAVSNSKEKPYGPAAPPDYEINYKLQKAAQKEAEEAAKRREEAQKKVATATDSLAKLEHQLQMQSLSDIDQVNLAYGDRIAEIAKLEAASGDHAIAESARALAYQEQQTALTKIEESLREERMKARQKEADEEQRLRHHGLAEELRVIDQKQKAQEAAAQAEAQRQAEQRSNVATTLGNVAALAGAIGDIIQQTYEDQADGAERGSKREKKARHDAAVAAKAVALVQAGINTALGISSALTLPPPYSYINAALVGVTGAIQIAAIASKSIPAAHRGSPVRGGMGPQPDEVPIMAQVGEGVISRRGMAALGGERALNRLNEGGSAQGGQVVQVIQAYEHRVFDAFARRDLQRPTGVLARAVRGTTLAGVR